VVLAENLSVFVIRAIRATFFMLRKLHAFTILLIFRGHAKTESPNVQFVIGLKLKEDISGKAQILFLYFIDFDLFICAIIGAVLLRIFITSGCLFMCTCFIQAVLNKSEVQSKFRTLPGT